MGFTASNNMVTPQIKTPHTISTKTSDLNPWKQKKLHWTKFNFLSSYFPLRRHPTTSPADDGTSTSTGTDTLHISTSSLLHGWVWLTYRQWNMGGRERGGALWTLIERLRSALPAWTGRIVGILRWPFTAEAIFMVNVIFRVSDHFNLKLLGLILSIWL
jgi:hypothetical protein